MRDRQYDNMNVKGYRNDRLTTREMVACIAVAAGILLLIALAVYANEVPLECL